MTDGLLATAVSRFLRYLGVERQLSPITLLNYQRQLEALIAMADDMHITAWSQHWKGGNRCAGWRRAADAAVKTQPASEAWRSGSLRCAAFFDWLVSQGVLNSQPGKRDRHAEGAAPSA